MIRLFVALELPESVRERLGVLQGGVPGARWVDDHQLHLTLRFIGEVTEDVGHDIDDALLSIRAPGFELDQRLLGERVGHQEDVVAGQEHAASLLPGHLLVLLPDDAQERGVEVELRRGGEGPGAALDQGAVAHHEEVAVAPCMQVSRATQRLPIMATILAQVVHEYDGECVAALERSEFSEEHRHFAGRVLIDAMQAHERIEDQ